MDSNSVVLQRYAELGPKRFVDLCESILILYDGPWMATRDCPEGCYNPDPQDQEKARRLWRNTYAKLKPYEEKIYEDYRDMKSAPTGAYKNDEKRIIRAMYLLCEAYHNNVELWDEVQTGTSNPPELDTIKTKSKNVKVEESKKADSPLKLMKKAHAYLLETHTYFAKTRLPKLKKDLKVFISKVPEEKKEEMLKKRKESLKHNLCDSGFFCKCPKWVPAEEGNPMDKAFCADESTGLNHRSYSICALNTFFDEAGVLDDDKLAIYIYDNQNEVTLSDVQKFYTYIDLCNVINDLLPFDENNIMLAVLPVKEAEPDSLDEPVKEEPKAMSELESNGPIMPIDDNPPADEPISINNIYTDKLRTESVYKAYCRVMREIIIPKVISKVSGQKRSEKWRWPHVYDALRDKRLGYIGADAGATDFGYAMKELHPELVPANVTQRLKDKKKSYPTTADKNIITDIIKILKP